MPSETPASFSPLTEGPTDPDLLLDFARRKVRGVIDSYHGRLDVFAEGCQNAVDALEKRWSNWSHEEEHQDVDLDALPRLRIILNFDENAVELIDNGTGISLTELPDLLRPFVTNKGVSSDPTRGHKGVGTTFLAFGHPVFEIHTKTSSRTQAAGYRIEGGRQWAMEDSATQPPEYHRVDTTHPSLNSFESGTYIKVGLDHSTGLRSLARVLHNTPKMWAEIFRSTTAVGNVHCGVKLRDLPDWARHIVIVVEHPNGGETPKFDFPLPHQLSDPNDARELQWLQNNPNTRREYSLIYLERTHLELNTLLGPQLTSLENDSGEDATDIKEAFEKYQPSVYAALAYKNTFYDEQFRTLIQRPNATNLSLDPGVGGGVMIASVGMPMVSLQPHLLETMQPQVRRRYFLLLHFNNNFSPDIGRKTVQQAVEPLVRWLEYELLKLLRTQERRLLRDRESGTRPSGATLAMAEQEIRVLAESITALEGMDDDLDFDGLILTRSPAWEDEVVALFVDLLGQDRLIGYKIRGIPGRSSRYDALFDYNLTSADQVGTANGLKVSEHLLGSDGIHLSQQWMEFKRDVNGFIADLELEDGDPAKKYFSQVNLLVVWSVSSITSDTYGLEPFDETNRKERMFFGTSHRLVVEGNDHVVEICELRGFLSTDS